MRFIHADSPGPWPLAFHNFNDDGGFCKPEPYVLTDSDLGSTHFGNAFSTETRSWTYESCLSNFAVCWIVWAKWTNRIKVFQGDLVLSLQVTATQYDNHKHVKSILLSSTGVQKNFWANAKCTNTFLRSLFQTTEKTANCLPWYFDDTFRLVRFETHCERPCLSKKWNYHL